MKIQALLRGLSVALVVSAIGATAVVAEEFEPTTLKVMGAFPTTPTFLVHEKPFWTKTIPQKLGKNVKIVLTNITELGLKGPEVFRLMKLGVLDFGTGVLSYTAGDDPQAEAIDLAGLSKDAKTLRKITEAYRPTLEKLYKDKYGIKALAIYPAHAQIFWCAQPISGLADLKGKKVRVFNTSMSDFIEGVGGTPVNVPFAEVVPALQRKVVDCAVTGALSGNQSKWAEVTSHMYPLPMGWALYMHGVSLKTWNAIEPKLQKALSREITNLEDRIWKSADKETMEGVNCSTGSGPCTMGIKGNLKLVKVSDKDAKVHHDLMKNVVLKRWGKRCGAACAKHWDETVGKILNLTASGN